MPTTKAPVTPRPRAEPPLDRGLPDHDVRRKRPPLLSFVLRMDTLRGAARVLSLLVLDLVAVFAAIFTALALKDAVLGDLEKSEVYDQTRDIVAFVFLVTVLLFARGSL